MGWGKGKEERGKKTKGMVQGRGGREKEKGGRKRKGRGKGRRKGKGEIVPHFLVQNDAKVSQ